MTPDAAPSTDLALPEGLLGLRVGPRVALVDARWLMAYAAGLGETDPRYFDTTAPAGPVVHPLVPVCWEWPLALDLRERAMDAAVAARGVHATHDLTIHRPLRAGERLTTVACVVGVEARRAGALLTTRFETSDDAGGPVATTVYGSLYRGVGARDATAAPPPEGRPSDAATAAVRWEQPVAVAATVAHVYTECARIWNPIHTDVSVARAAGLPAIILHGTATLGFAVSAIVARDLRGNPARVRRVAARFTGMVPLPAALTVRARGPRGATVAFDVVDADGAAVLSAGVVTT